MPKIEKGIPIPIPKTGRNGTIAPVMRAMKVGDSVFLTKSRSTATAQAIRYIGKGNYTLRVEAKGFRVWRIK